MRRRITFVQRADAPFDIDQAVITNDALSIRHLDGAREDRATLSFDELPSEIRQVLRSCRELHIRWATERPYQTGPPFSSRISPGLHVFYTPGGQGKPTGGLCALLKKVFDELLECESPESSFIRPPVPSNRFASTAAFQYYSPLPSLDNLVTFIQHKFCDSSDDKCHRHAEELRSADSVDVNYDSISHSLTVSGYWSKSPAQGWTEEIESHAAGAGQVEVGLLGVESAVEPEELKMGGLLGVVGQDEKLKPALFSFPSRHHPLPADATYSVSFPPPTGLHPTMTISLARAALDRPPAPEDATCAMYTYLTLPSAVFGDKYQLSTTDRMFLDSHRLGALRAVAGETDLEAPDWVVSRWGSIWLLELAVPDQAQPPTGDWNVTVPLHLRYLQPSESGFRSAGVSWPVVFWACAADDDSEIGINPFDRVDLGWDRLFGPRTMFYQLHPSPGTGRLVEELEVPVLRLDGEGWFQRRTVELGTVAVIVTGLVWVLWKLGLVAWSRKDKRGKTE